MGSQGCLGNSLTNDIHRPTHLSIKDQLIVEIVAGAYHSMALTKTNSILFFLIKTFTAGVWTQGDN